MTSVESVDPPHVAIMWLARFHLDGLGPVRIRTAKITKAASHHRPRGPDAMISGMLGQQFTQCVESLRSAQGRRPTNSIVNKIIHDDVVLGQTYLKLISRWPYGPHRPVYRGFAVADRIATASFRNQSTGAIFY